MCHISQIPWHSSLSLIRTLFLHSMDVVGQRPDVMAASTIRWRSCKGCGLRRSIDAGTCFGFSTYQPYDPKKNKNQPYYQHVGGSCQTEEEEPDNTCNGGWIFAALQYASQFGIGSNKTYPYPQDEYNYGVPQDSGVCRVNPGYSYQPPTFSSVPLSRGQPDMLADNVYALMRVSPCSSRASSSDLFLKP